MKFIFIVLLGFTSFISSANDFRITIPIGSKHILCSGNACGSLNESNTGIGTEYFGYGTFAFKNSYNRLSIGIYKAFEYNITRYLGLGIRLGGATGYEEESGMDIVPLAQPYLKMSPIQQVNVNLGILPVGLINAKGYNAVITLDTQILF